MGDGGGTRSRSDGIEARVDALLAELTPEERASLTGGDDVWHLPAVPRLGIGRLKMSDGPSGVRGERFGTRRSMAFPCGTAVGATWDPVLVARYGRALADEARAKGVHVLLGPTVGIVRTPLAGRTFESFAEDPVLTARLAVAYVAAVQAGGVGCCIKHFACNDQEHERMTISAEVDEVTLRELHLPAFEAAVREAGAWSVMSAYNKVGGTWCGEHPRLLGEILKGEWGFDGVVVSDWFGTHSTAPAAAAGLDVEMPGPPAHLGPHLAAAVDAGDVEAGTVEGSARRILRLAARTDLLDGGVDEPDEAEVDDPAGRALARELAAAGTVLLRNDGVLPLRPAGGERAGAVARVALVGPNAELLETGGGGSSAVVPHRRPSLPDELAARLPGVEVVHEAGCRIDVGLPLADPRLLDDGEGLRLEHHADPAFGGEPVAVERLGTSSYVALGDPVPGVTVGSCSLRARATFRPDVSGVWQLGVANVGATRVLLDGEVAVDNTEPTPGGFFYGIGSGTVTADVPLEAGRAYDLVVELRSTAGLPAVGFRLAAARPAVPDAWGAAVRAAAEVDVPVVVVGSNREWESEGADRPDLRLVGDQEVLVREVVAANPRTVVVVNAGAPVDLRCTQGAAAVVLVWYPGEEGAPALADVLTGAAEPGGRLPVTFPARLEDTAVHGGPRRYPGVEGTVVYEEGLLVGYRHHDAAGIEPAFCFGHGLGYTTWSWGEPAVEVDGATDLAVRVALTNTGARAGSEVVQCYVAPVAVDEPASNRPVQALAGFAKVTAEPGETVAAEVVLGARAFRRWDPGAGDWVVHPGEYEVRVAASSRDVRGRATVRIGG